MRSHGQQPTGQAASVVGERRDTTATEADWRAAQARVRRLKYVMMLVAAVVLPALSIPAMLLADATSGGGARTPLTVVWDAVVLLPAAYAVLRISISQQHKTDLLIGGLTRQLSAAVREANDEAGEREVQARRQQFESRLANALDMAEGEPEVIDVIERSFASTLPGAPVELLLADNSHAHLLRMAASPSAGSPGCGVDSPDQCPAARRAQAQRFPDSEELDACPKLRNREGGAVSALCMPVSIMGRTVGVIHATGERQALIAEDRVEDLGVLAKLAGARIGLLRVMAETQLQAATDSLTGLLNRRSFERRLAALRPDGANLSMAMADLDHFKTLNDTFGHDTGDRALRLFAQVLTDSLRSQDIVCRHGGEEFVVALPGCPPANALHVLDGVRVKLDAAIAVAGLPVFTVSFGVVQAGNHEDLTAVIGRADAALFQAKRDGRNRVVVHDDPANVVRPVATTHDGAAQAPSSLAH